MTQVAATHRMVFDIHEDDVYWCAADCGWVTGHSYIVYGPLANHTTGVMYEGAPDWPDKDRWWDIVERYGVTILYTAPTAIRAFMRWGTEHPDKHDLSSLRLLGFGRRADQPGGVGLVLEGDRRRALPRRRHVVADRDRRDPDHAAARAHHAQARLGDVPVPGHRGRRRRRARAERGPGRRRLPGAAAPLARDRPHDLGRSRPLRRDLLRSQYGPEVYVAGDGARRDDEGYFWLLGRIDDVMNVAGHRLSTFEIESALVDDEKVAEAAVVSRPHDDQGRGHRGVRDA